MAQSFFSINCKVDSVCGELTTEQGRAEAIRIFHELGVKKVWLEIYRNRNFVSRGSLVEIQKALALEGFETGAVIVPTRMSDRVACGWDSVTCFTDPSSRKRMEEVVARGAELFDSLLFDDFLFTTCLCPECEAQRGTRSHAEFRSELLLEVIRENIIKVARKIKPAVKLIVKYPCWYESYRANGYDILADSALFDATWAGTETRDVSIPQAKAWWIQRWLDSFSRCEGGWFDPLSCPPEIYVEQARNTILGGAPEVLLHCYDYIFLSESAFTQDGGGLQVVPDRACADALMREMSGLKKLAALLENMTPYGVATLKMPNVDASSDAGLQPWFNMTGIPLTAESALSPDRVKSVILTAHAAAFEHAAAIPGSSVPYLLTESAAKLLGVSPDDPNILPPLENGADLKNLENLDGLRNRLLAPFGIEFHAPWKVSLLLFENNGRFLEVIQNFNDHPVEFELHCGGAARVPLLTLPSSGAAQALGDGKYRLEKRSLLVIGSRK